MDSCTGPMVILYDPTARDDIYCRCSSTVTALCDDDKTEALEPGGLVPLSGLISVCIAYCYLETISIRET